MLRVSKKLHYALEAVVDIAYNGGAEPVRSRDITRRQGIPNRYLEQVMQRLVRANILRGVRGPRGGYLLARERRRISIGDIARVVDALEMGEEDTIGTTASELGSAVLTPFWHELQEDVMAKVDAISIEDLCWRAGQANVESEAKPHADFTI